MSPDFWVLALLAAINLVVLYRVIGKTRARGEEVQQLFRAGHDFFAHASRCHECMGGSLCPIGAIFFFDLNECLAGRYSSQGPAGAGGSPAAGG